MTKRIYIVLFWFISSISIQAQISDKITINKQDIKSVKVNGYDRISWKSNFLTQEVGNPELPVYRVSYVFPVDAQVTGVSFTTQTKQKHDQNFNIIPVQQPGTI